MDEQDVRARLLAGQEATRARVAAMSAELDAIGLAAADSNRDDEHDPEGATIAFERAQLAALRDQACRGLDELDQALARLEAGRYGICESCESAIGDERLAARPSVRKCVNCAAPS